MARIILVTGGCRSGKSLYAQKVAEEFASDRCYIATCPVIDDEIGERVERHKADRAGRNWRTIEEQIDLSNAFGACQPHESVLVDCLTLWVNNIMYRAEQNSDHINEDGVRNMTERMLEAADVFPGQILFVTNEVGMGIVPSDENTRLYRDLVGRCNQTVAKKADEVVFMACGLPLKLKG
ncbi:MAG: bifunctional adenosylcobinamide kinase/adenosylcobinamide-phosphate guanylyltransferase [Planctomycetes bacterium]|nr:bifunctional adenosylcobinamide kinase/adenosylcobinamide-phosphate guanylyltransferase [Planctomycetota bacterium]